MDRRELRRLASRSAADDRRRASRRVPPGRIGPSAVVALMTRASVERLRTFSVGFGAEGGIDRRSAAQVMAQHYGTEHTEVVVTGRGVRERLPAIIRAMDQPVATVSTRISSAGGGATREGRALGLGGDELFAGCPQFKLFGGWTGARRLGDCRMPCRTSPAAPRADRQRRAR